MKVLYYYFNFLNTGIWQFWNKIEQIAFGKWTFYYKKDVF